MKKILVLLLAFVLCFAGCSAEEPASEPEKPEEFVPARGTVENGIYKNSAFGVSFSAEEDWYFLSDSEIAQTMGIAAEEMFGEGTEVEPGNIYDMYCVDMETNATVSVNYENVAGTENITNEGAYLEIVTSQIVSAGASSGVKDAFIGDVEIGGVKTTCLNIELEVSGVKIYEKIVAKQIGDWMCSITVASLSETEMEDLIGRISFE
jgi:hypothetical protein